MLGKVCNRFVEQSPIAVMVRGTLERVLGADQRDAGFARTAQKQYTRTVLFSTVYDRPRSPRRPRYTFRGGLSGAGATSTDSSIAANIERGFWPKKRSAAVVPSDRVRKKWPRSRDRPLGLHEPPSKVETSERPRHSSP